MGPPLLCFNQELSKVLVQGKPITTIQPATPQIPFIGNHLTIHFAINNGLLRCGKRF